MQNEIPLSPPFRIAIIGGGQLGKMMTAAAKQMGFHVTVLDPTPASPAGQMADRQVVAAFDDGESIRRVAEEAEVVTYEFEHIDSTSLLELEEEGRKIFPTPRVLQTIQNKFTQKQVLARAGIPVPSFSRALKAPDLEKAAQDYGYPFLLKSCTGGYDGKGNLLIEGPAFLPAAEDFMAGREVMAERHIPFALEVSVLTVRDRFGNIRSYPISENEHQENILRKSIVPARISARAARRARQVAEEVTSVFSGVGIICVEMFVTQEDEILVNEVAPRPHNSGHYTIEACVTSQFEQHIRAITGLPLGDTSLVQPAVMVNLLGEEGHQGGALMTGVSHALAVPGVHLHFYGKHQTAPRRKMGHFTVTAETLELALARAEEAARHIRVVAERGQA